MSSWRVQLFGPLVLLKDGEPVRLRTRHHALLLAQLVARNPQPTPRGEAAELLWPDAHAQNATAYLRRVLKELRDLGLPIRDTANGLELDRSRVESDLDEYRHRESQGLTEPTDLPLLQGLHDPMALEIRMTVRQQFEDSQRGRVDASRLRRAAPPGGDGTLEWLGEAVLNAQPALALEIVARRSDFRFHDNPPERILGLLTRILRANPAGDPATDEDRLRVLIVASHNALLLTRVGQAEMLALTALAEARARGCRAGEARALSALTAVLRETGQWDLAVERAREAVAAVEGLHNPVAVAHARGDLASVLLHRSSFREAGEEYRLAWEAIPGEWDHRIATTNLVHLWAVHGVPLTIPVEPYAPPGGARVETGYSGWVESCLEFSTGFGLEDREGAAQGVQRMLAVTAGEGMERLLCVALDSAAFVFERLGQHVEAAACVRAGTRLRLRIGHPRSPGEKSAIRRHVRPPFFGARVAAIAAAWDVDEIETMAARIAAAFVLPEKSGPARRVRR